MVDRWVASNTMEPKFYVICYEKIKRKEKVAGNGTLLKQWNDLPSAWQGCMVSAFVPQSVVKGFNPSQTIDISTDPKNVTQQKINNTQNEVQLSNFTDQSSIGYWKTLHLRQFCLPPTDL